MKRKSTLKLKVVFTSTDLKSSAEDVVDLGIQIEELLKKFKGKSQLFSKEFSIENSDPLPQLAARLKKLTRKSSGNRKKGV